jgi:hypothetical protein
MSKLLIYSMYHTDPYWRYVADRIETASDKVILSDTKGFGDVNTMPRFYDVLKDSVLLSKQLDRVGPHEIADVIARCRTLRCLDPDQAKRMALAMWVTLDEIIEREKPDAALSFCIDRYSMDILGRVCESRGIPFVEVTASPLVDNLLFLRRGTGIPVTEPTDAECDKAARDIVNPDFAPIYVQNETDFGVAKFWKTFLLFEARGHYFNLLRHWRHDRLSCHYLDAQKWLHHKIGWGDWRIFRYLRSDWKTEFEAAPFERRVFLGLQLYPEASMDYWLQSLDLLNYYEATFRIARLLSEAGLHIFVKDHPLMFGFRQEKLFRQLSLLPNVTFVPYGVSGKFLIDQCLTTVTMSGTIGLEAALAGRCAVVAEGGFYFVRDAFVSYRDVPSLDTLPRRIQSVEPPADLQGKRRHILRELLKCSAPGRLTKLSRFSARDVGAARDASILADSVSRYLPTMIEHIRNNILSSTVSIGY